MKKLLSERGTLIAIISYIITFISATVIPDLMIKLFDFSIVATVLIILISVLLLFVMLLLKSVLEKRIPVNYTDLIEVKHWIENRKIKNLNIYAISSAYWLDSIETLKNVQIEHCVVFIRNNPELTSSEYKGEVERTLKKWKELRRKNIILDLKIYEYNHISDHYFAIFDDSLLLTGLNIFRDEDSTLQYGDRKAQCFFNNSEKNKQIIDSYQEQFDNYLEKYKGNVLYDNDM